MSDPTNTSRFNASDFFNALKTTDPEPLKKPPPPKTCKICHKALGQVNLHTGSCGHQVHNACYDTLPLTGNPPTRKCPICGLVGFGYIM